MENVHRRRIVGGSLGAFALFAVLGPMRCPGQTLISVFDEAPPVGQSYFLGFLDDNPFPITSISQQGEAILDVTMAETYVAPPYSGGGLAFTRIFDATNVIGGMDSTSHAAAYPSEPGTPAAVVFTSFNVFSYSASTLTYTSASVIPSISVNSLGNSLDQLPSSIAAGASGQMYVASDLGIQLYASTAASLPTLTFANSGPGLIDAAGAMAVGPGGLIYAMDTALNRIAIYSASGVYQGSIPLTGTNASTALAVNAAGYVFTANGDGGGSIYSSATDNLVGSFSSSAIDGDGTLGNTSLAVNSSGDLYLYDQTTGIHVFETSAIPEPADWTLIVGVAALLLVGARRFGRDQHGHRTPPAPNRWFDG